MTIALNVHYSLGVLRKALSSLQHDIRQLEENPTANMEYLIEKHETPRYSKSDALHLQLSGRAADLERAVQFLTSFGGYVLDTLDGSIVFNDKAELDRRFEEMEDISDLGSYRVYPMLKAPFLIDIEKEYGRDDIEIGSGGRGYEGEVKYDLFWQGNGAGTQESRDLSERELQSEIAELLNDGLSTDDIVVEKKTSREINFSVTGGPVTRVTYIQKTKE